MELIYVCDIKTADVKDDLPSVPDEGALLPAINARFVYLKCMKMFIT